MLINIYRKIYKIAGREEWELPGNRRGLQTTRVAEMQSTAHSQQHYQLN